MVSEHFLNLMIFINKSGIMDTTRTIPTTLTKQELTSIKITLFEMIKDSGKMERPYYESLAESLDGLNFKEFTLGQFAKELSSVVEEMLDLADLAFDMGQLNKYHYQLG